jgi:hypothetical protein
MLNKCICVLSLSAPSDHISGVLDVKDGIMQTDKRLGAWNVGSYDPWPRIPLQVSCILVHASLLAVGKSACLQSEAGAM